MSRGSNLGQSAFVGENPQNGAWIHFHLSAAAAADAAGQASLGTKERKVLSLVEHGLSNREIADAMFLSERTVKWHLSNIFGKLDVANRTAAVRKARMANLLD